MVQNLTVRNGYVYADGVRIGRLVKQGNRRGLEFVEPRSGRQRERGQRRRVVVDLEVLADLK